MFIIRSSYLKSYESLRIKTSECLKGIESANPPLHPQLREFEGDLGGLLVLRDGQRDVRDFIAHYRLLTPEKNTRNPWFTQYWRQVGGARIFKGCRLYLRGRNI